MDWEDEEEFPGRPFGPKPFGPKPFGPKPFGPKPFGPKPFGPKQFGTRPFGPKPFGPKPFGPKAGGADEADGGFLDLDEWNAEIADLVCGRSAVIRLGATLVAGEQGAALPVVDFQVKEGFRSPGKPEPDPGEAVGDEDDPLRPGEWDLSAGIAVSQRVRAAVASSPDLAYALKAQLADALARGVDKTVLQGVHREERADGEEGMDGEKKGGLVRATPSREDHLTTARGMLNVVRNATQAFRNPGWILGPNTLDELTRLVTADGLSAVEEGAGARTLDSYELLQLDGIDGGVFLGFPFVLSAGAEPNIYFAADWQEAWIGVATQFVSVTTQPASADAIVFRAALPFDFALGNKAGFVGRGPDDGSERTPSPTE